VSNSVDAEPRDTLNCSHIITSKKAGFYIFFFSAHHVRAAITVESRTHHSESPFQLCDQERRCTHH